MKRIAIIGAGLSGLTLAHLLKKHADVTLFEKSRGVGGRLATRRALPFFFDHGAQFFRIRTNSFRAFAQAMIDADIIVPWHARFVELADNKIMSQRHWNEPIHFVGNPGMNAIGKYLAKHLDIRVNTEVALIKKSIKWQLIDTNQHVLGDFDWVICTAPVQQTLQLIPNTVSFYTDILPKQMHACFSLMLGFDAPLVLPFDAALVRKADISWISINSHKPGRPDYFAMLVHSTNAWANKHIDDDRRSVSQYLCQQTSEVIGHDVSHARHIDLHAWRYANVDKQSGSPFYIDSAVQLAACGDWCIQGRVEAAFTSAMKLAEDLKPRLTHT